MPRHTPNGFGVWGSWLRVWGSGSWHWDLGCRVSGLSVEQSHQVSKVVGSCGLVLEFGVEGLWCGVRGAEFEAQGVGVMVLGVGLRVEG